MSAQVIDGRALAADLRRKIAGIVPSFEKACGRRPGLAVVLVGDDPASQVYVRSKHKATIEVGMESFEHRLPAAAGHEELLGLIQRLNADTAVDGILVQLPLPDHLNEALVIAAIDTDKDVDGFHPINAGRLTLGQRGYVPCTPLGCLMILKRQLGSLDGLEAVVVGRSNIVGRPMAQLLLQENCTVTIAHSKTKNLPQVVRRADIVIAAVGRPELIEAGWIKPGAVVIDVGINRVARADGGSALVGDVAYAECAAVAGAITPVPGGVGPMTIAVLLSNTLLAAHNRAEIRFDDRALWKSCTDARAASALTMKG